MYIPTWKRLTTTSVSPHNIPTQTQPAKDSVEHWIDWHSFSFLQNFDSRLSQILICGKILWRKKIILRQFKLNGELKSTWNMLESSSDSITARPSFVTSIYEASSCSLLYSLYIFPRGNRSVLLIVTSKYKPRGSSPGRMLPAEINSALWFSTVVGIWGRNGRLLVHTHLTIELSARHSKSLRGPVLHIIVNNMSFLPDDLMLPIHQFIVSSLFQKKKPRVSPICRVNRWFRRLFWSYSLSACDNSLNSIFQL